MVEVITRFGQSKRRREIIRGLLRLRADLAALGVSDGFQWVSGSFVEEGLGREPGDVDVVTFTRVGTNAALDLAIGPLVAGKMTRKTHEVDSFLIDLSWASEAIVANAVYWYELWSSRKVGGRKGFVQIELNEDLGEARRVLQEMDDA